ncbi:hypothetical protein EMIHUDRAFT_249410 [Emiliania huxleyi CCMP1516]|uniref:Uncharacterized protein n=2 Tax=Emiliania huxleyi TaxID=2903 RepID=A0A0D3I960_EMIH1|nr:hypothetical protein EMIHUDRAFT_249410 [Emiliania huxleyi CCMP1516]EOD07795.1 hypothetical protein EMIHUDRAFT_249410 [Emiliania huxleyi CCMP1516]|eukprot:XP_005760224.1 hypothetical protein EMIHUDRAFT_249410 [Emiliania huxleyi CCMP1516]
MCQSEAPDAAPVKPDAAPPASKPKPQAEELAAIRHSPQRKRAIALGRPSDAAGECDVVADPRFDIDKTIFGTLTSPIKRWVQSAKLNHVETWHAEPLAGIESAFAAVSVPRSVSDDAPLFRFMAEECDFSLEHADGSFMDHLHFCADYSALHFSALARRAAYALRSLLDEEEFAQISAFPSVLRLMAASEEELGALRGLSCRRVLDNAEVHLSSEQLWAHLNYQLIHLIDFLPATAWQVTFNDYFAVFFVRLHALLQRAGKLPPPLPGRVCHSLLHISFVFLLLPGRTSSRSKLLAGVAYQPEWAKPLLPNSRPSSWAHCGKAIRGYSAEIGHSLDYTLLW